MTEKPKRKTGGSNLTRSEIVQVRLDPKLRFAAEQAAAKERQTLSSFIERAVKMAVHQVIVTKDDQGTELTAAALADRVWDVDKAECFVHLARQHPTLLTQEERRKWKFIFETQEFWLARDRPNPEPNKPAIRLAWDLITQHLDEQTPFAWARFAALAAQHRIAVEWGPLPIPPDPATISHPTA
jgi:uncharacterized protein (DUF1778 family)